MSFENEAPLEKAFRELVSSTKRPILLVVAPIHGSYLESFQNKTDKDQYLKAFAAEYDNVTVLDYSDEPYDDSLFFDTTHLNFKGAQVFSERLRQDLESLMPTVFYASEEE